MDSALRVCIIQSQAAYVGDLTSTRYLIDLLQSGSELQDDDPAEVVFMRQLLT